MSCYFLTVYVICVILYHTFKIAGGYCAKFETSHTTQKVVPKFSKIRKGSWDSGSRFRVVREWPKPFPEESER